MPIYLKLVVLECILNTLLREECHHNAIFIRESTAVSVMDNKIIKIIKHPSMRETKLMMFNLWKVRPVKH